MIRTRLPFLALAAAVLLLPDARADAVQAPAFSTMDRDTYVVAYEEFAGMVWEGTSLLYTRLDEGLLEKVPGRVWTDEDRAMAGCGYDYLAKRDQLGELDTFAENAVEAVKIIEADKTITMISLIKGTAAVPGMQPNETMTAAMLDCGSLQLTAERMQEMGTLEAVMEILMEEMAQ